MYTFKPKGYGDIPKITMAHYAMRTWPGSGKPVELYGHSHGMLRRSRAGSRSMSA
jgi:hypothetical protein